MRIGVDLGGTKIEAIVLDDDGAERVRRRIDSPQGSYHATIDAIAGLVSAVAEETDCRKDLGVGIGIPGATSPETGNVKNANSTWLIGHPLDRDLTDALARPVRIANDANCFAVSEATDGAGANYGMVFGIILGTGVGGGIAIDGRTHTGINAIAGEWGHNPLPWPQNGDGVNEHAGPTCYCGKQGCIETFLSGPALSRDYAAAGGAALSASDIAARADTGDALATAAIHRYAHRLARALSSVINILDPDAIIVGGGLSNLSEIYKVVPEMLNRFVFSDVCTTPFLPNKHGDSSGVRGAAWLFPPTTSESA
jgi:fructokinase